MAATYAAYSNLSHGAQGPQSEKSARSSVSSTASSTTPASAPAKKSKWQRFVDELKPLEQPQGPITIYGPLVFEKKNEKTSRQSSTQERQRQSSSRRASEIYAAFKDKVGGEKVYFRG
ncbi:hypothetical protein PMZ80_008391 [Knufia obscura]|uniref:Uncharacterized protein n=2 Tax=Knufia TaxID=430999 RepID=A0AAN8I646_9EURO|nr:hypothetical protein PMZ80_008391 [Knufia obscura]KAK5951276.1 hypothetical protein OHC33_007694 [Knufia fluminis]